jgi:hypothetical protein
MREGGTRCPQRVGYDAAAPDICAFGDKLAIVFGEVDPRCLGCSFIELALEICDLPVV